MQVAAMNQGSDFGIRGPDFRIHAPTPPTRPPGATARKSYGRILVQQSQSSVSERPTPDSRGHLSRDSNIIELEGRIGLSREEYIMKCVEIISQHAIHKSGTRTTSIWRDLSWISASANRIGSMLEQRLAGAVWSARKPFHDKIQAQAQEISSLQVVKLPHMTMPCVSRIDRSAFVLPYSYFRC